MVMKLHKPSREANGEQTFPANEMVPGPTYMTAQSPAPKQVPCRLVKVDYSKKQVLLAAYYRNLDEWSEVWVDWDYKIRNQRGEEQMAMKMKAKAKAGKVSKTKGATTGVGVFDTWGIAFKKHGSDPKSVVKFMKDEYPGRETDWAKWVDGMRQRYNRGLLTGGDQPSKPIPSYKKNGKPEAKKKK